jgi:RNA polymerase sigma factor (sigma-70 family)
MENIERGPIATTKPEDDASLLRACRAGDALAWEQLLDRYERLVYSIARNNGLSPEDAADITQITFGYLLQSLGQMTDEGNLRAWLATVAKRHSRRLLVRQLRYQSAEVDEEIMAGFLPDRTNINEIDRWELAEWLRHGLDRIDERCRQLLRALYFDPSEPSYAQVATRLDIAEGSVGPIRARCLDRLRQVLADEQDNI